MMNATFIFRMALYDHLICFVPKILDFFICKNLINITVRFVIIDSLGCYYSLISWQLILSSQLSIHCILLTSSWTSVLYGSDSFKTSFNTLKVPYGRLVRISSRTLFRSVCVAGLIISSLSSIIKTHLEIKLSRTVLSSTVLVNKSS